MVVSALKCPVSFYLFHFTHLDKLREQVNMLQHDGIYAVDCVYMDI